MGNGTTDQPTAFLSHSSADHDFVHRLAFELAADGVHVWVDEAEMRVGDHLIDKIGRAIEQTDFLIVVLSKASTDRRRKSSRWVMEELDAAFVREMQGRRVRILPCRIEACRVPRLFSARVFADFEKLPYEDAYSLLLSALVPTMTPWERTRTLMVLAKRIEASIVAQGGSPEGIRTNTLKLAGADLGAAAYALGHILPHVNPLNLPLIMEACLVCDPALAHVVVYKLVLHPKSWSLAEILPLTAQKEPRLRRIAVAELELYYKETGDEAAKATIVELLGDPDHEVGQQATRALSALGVDAQAPPDT